MDGSKGPQGPEQPAGRTFDPRPHLRRIRFRGQEADYLDVKWRLAWLRTEHPDARITTEHVTLTDALAVFRATVEVPAGGAATGYGSETAGDFPDYIEKAETKAIGRALAALGYGTQFALDFDLEEGAGAGAGPVAGPIADAPVERSPESRPAPRLRTVAPPEPEAEPEPAVSPAPRPVRPPARAAREPEPATPTNPEFNPAAVSWTDFWKEARRLGYNSRSELATLLGHEIDTSMTPADVWGELVAYRREHGQPDEDE